MKETVMSGENVLAFNIIGSYALAWAKDNDSLGAAFGTDYTASLSRVAGIIKGAPHPEAAKLFLDFMLSQEGQAALASVGLPSLRTDVDTGYNLTTISAAVGGNLKPIALDDTLLEYMEPTKRVEFLKMWAEAK
jgi:iron(III) transport system substrate-binding protein